MTKQTIFRLINTIQSYDWGHKTALQTLFSLPNPAALPQAEIWMGAHPKAPSLLEFSPALNQSPQALDQFIQIHKEEVLGLEVYRDFKGRLPFLFKILAIAKPLSIQVHPHKQQAQAGFNKENAQAIPIDAFHRNYRDSNHKPELIYALTPFQAMNGFRPVSEIIRLFRLIDNPILSSQLDILQLSKNEGKNTHTFETFYRFLMCLQSTRRYQLLADALAFAAVSHEPAYKVLAHLHQYFPGDIGVLSPLFLNLVNLQPGEAMFLKTGTLHAYLEGSGLEVMANSDNVLRGGLTPKHVDVAELLKTIVFESVPPNTLRVKPIMRGSETIFPVPVPDFTFGLIKVSALAKNYTCNAVEILCCINGKVLIQAAKGQTLKLKPGQSCLIMAQTNLYSLQGSGLIARASVYKSL